MATEAPYFDIAQFIKDIGILIFIPKFINTCKKLIIFDLEYMSKYQICSCKFNVICEY